MHGSRHELCRTLMTPEGKVVKKPRNPTINQYLKVLEPVFGTNTPPLIDVPNNLRHACDNTLMVDNNTVKNISNPTSNYIVCPTWIFGTVQNRLLMDLHRYLQVLVGSGLPVPQFLSSNPIGNRYMDPKNYMHRELYAHAKCNKLI